MAKFNVEGIGEVEIPDNATREQAYAILQQRMQKSAPPPSQPGILGQAEAFLRGIPSGALQSVASIPEGIGGVFDSQTLKDMGAGIRESSIGKYLTDIPEELRGSYGQQAGEITGQLATLLTPGAAMKAAKLPAYLGSAASVLGGMAQGSSEQVQRANENRAQGMQVSPDDETWASRLGSLTGLLEIFPYSKLMPVATKAGLHLAKEASEQGFGKLLGRVAGTAGVEGVTEGSQQTLQNIIEGQYNAGQRMDEGVLPAAGAGSAAGAVLDLLLKGTGRGVGRNIMDRRARIESPNVEALADVDSVSVRGGEGGDPLVELLNRIAPPQTKAPMDLPREDYRKTPKPAPPLTPKEKKALEVAQFQAKMQQAMPETSAPIDVASFPQENYGQAGKQPVAPVVDEPVVAPPVEAPVPQEAAAPEVVAETPEAPAGTWQDKGKLRIRTEDLAIDPIRFQYKVDNIGQGGVTDELKDIGKWDDNAAGTVFVWKDPADNKSYVVNGHHRYDLARRLGVPDIGIKYIDAVNSTAARAAGALQNIREGKGSAIDAAKFLRDTGKTIEDLKAENISVKGEKARVGAALANLAPSIFDDVVHGNIKPERAAIVGAGLNNYADQKAVLKLADSKRATNAEVEEMIRLSNARKDAAPPPKTGEAEKPWVLFEEDGDAADEPAYIYETSQISSYVRSRLRQEKRLFGLVGSKEAAKNLSVAGNDIKADANKQISDEANEALFFYDKLSALSGPVSNLLNDGAKRIANGEKPDAVKDSIYESIRGEVAKVLPGSKPANVRKADAGGMEVGNGRVQEDSRNGSLAFSVDPETPATTPYTIDGLAEEINAGKKPAIAMSVFGEMKRLGVDDLLATRLIDDLATPEGGNAAGSYGNRIVQLALNGKSEADILRTLNHESVHAMKQMGLFTDLEWDILNASFNPNTSLTDYEREQYGKLYQGDTGRINEEAIARGIEKFSAGQMDAPKAAASIATKAVGMVDRLGNMLRGKGFKNAEDVMTAFRAGEMGGRDPKLPAKAPAARTLKDYEKGQYDKAVTNGKAVKQVVQPTKNKQTGKRATALADLIDQDQGAEGEVEKSYSVDKPEWLDPSTPDKRYAKIADTVDGRKVRDRVPNMDSIDSSFEDYEILPGIREVPLSDFEAPPSVNSRTKGLAAEIAASGEISPLIVAIDDQGPYILEGAHRYDALKIMGAKSFPAVVVVDTPKWSDDTSYSIVPQLPVSGTSPFAKPDDRPQLKKAIDAFVKPAGLGGMGLKFRQSMLDMDAGIAALGREAGDITARTGSEAAVRNFRVAQDFASSGINNGALEMVGASGDGFFRIRDDKHNAPATVFTELYQKGKLTRFFHYLAAEKSSELMKEGRENKISAQDIAAWKAYGQDADIADAAKRWKTFNDQMVDTLQKSGRIDAATAATFKKNLYLPYYRINENADGTVGFQSSGATLASSPRLERLKGGKLDIGDPTENIIRNVNTLTSMAMKNEAMQRVARDGLQTGYIKQVPKASGGKQNIKVWVNGKEKHFEVLDPILYESITASRIPLSTSLSILGFPSKLLREAVTLDPVFMFNNAVRDSTMAWLQGYTDFPMQKLVQSAKKALTNAPDFQKLERLGVIGNNIRGEGGAAGTGRNLRDIYEGKKMHPIKTAQEFSRKSEGINRLSVYEDVMKRTGGDEAQAQYEARELLNFNRRGAWDIVQFINALIPFQNAAWQGADVVYRGVTGKGVNPQAQKQIRNRMMAMAALSAAYTIMASEMPEWQNASEEERDANWFLPGGGKVKIPFEAGYVAKVVPERLTAMYLGHDTGKEFVGAFRRFLKSTIKLDVIPQAMKPAQEVATNYNTFRDKSIEPEYMRDKEKEQRYDEYTSEVAKGIAKYSWLSPLQIDHLLRGYGGTLGTYGVQALSTLASPGKAKAAMSFDEREAADLPVVGRFFQRELGPRQLIDFYETTDAGEAAASALKAGAEPSEKRVALAQYANAAKPIQKAITAITKQEKQIRKLMDAGEMPPDQARVMLREYKQRKIELAKQANQMSKGLR